MAEIKGIRKREAGYQWNITYKKQRRVGTTQTLEEAIRERKNAMTKLMEELDGAEIKTGPTLQELVILTQQTRWRGQKSERTHLINAKIALNYFGEDCPITTITTKRINDYAEHLRETGSTGGTINRKLSNLSTILKTAEDHGMETANPKIRRSKEYRGRERFITEEEEAQMLYVLVQWGAIELHDVIVTLVDTGIRCGELFALEKTDVDFSAGSNGIITLWRTKNDRPRSVPITRRVKAIIEKRMVNAGARLFPITQSWLRTGWDRLKAYLGLEEDAQFVPHILRHTCASRLVQRGIPLMEVQRWMGHASLQSTMRYSHLSPSSLYSVVDVLENHGKPTQTPTATTL